jgi:ubiquitin thioesterase protein OTUB1
MDTRKPGLEMTDEQILDFENEIKDKEAQVNALVSIPLPIQDLLEEYQGNEPFLQKIRVR